MRLGAAIVLVLASAIGPGCATAKEVRAIVSETNALMVAPTPDEAGEQAGADWKSASDRIEALIQANPDEPTLHAALRTRQALLLSTHEQDALARGAWKQVDPSKLRTDRDRAFYLLREERVWWDKQGPSAIRIPESDWSVRLGDEDEEEPPAAGDLASLDLEGKSTLYRYEAVCNALPTDSPTRLFLEIERANIVIRIFQDAPVQRQEDRARIAAEYVRSLDRIADLLTKDERGWLGNAENRAWLNFAPDPANPTSNPHDAAPLPEGIRVGHRARYLSAARLLIQETREQAATHEPRIAVAAWSPDWLDRILEPVAEGG